MEVAAAIKAGPDFSTFTAKHNGVVGSCAPATEATAHASAACFKEIHIVGQAVVRIAVFEPYSLKLVSLGPPAQLKSGIDKHVMQPVHLFVQKRPEANFFKPAIRDTGQPIVVQEMATKPVFGFVTSRYKDKPTLLAGSVVVIISDVRALPLEYPN